MLTLGAAIAAAGVDPEVRADVIMQANASEIDALATTFAQAAKYLESSADIANFATCIAHDAALIADATPIDLMDEVTATIQSLDIGPAEVAQIASLLDSIAQEIPLCQLKAQGAIGAMHDAYGILRSGFELAMTLVSYESADPFPEFLAKAVDIVLGADSEVSSIITVHDNFLLDVAAKLQSLGYLLPPQVSTGDSGSIGVAVIPLFGPGTAAETVASWWAGLSQEQQIWLISHAASGLLGLHGLPAAVLNLVARRVLTDEDVATTHNLEAAAAVLIDQFGLPSNFSLEELIDFAEGVVSSTTVTEEWAVCAAFLGALGLSGNVAKTQESAANDDPSEPRHLLEFDLTGDGTAVIAIGDLDNADNIAVSVPGVASDLGDIQGQTKNGENLQDQMDEAAPDEENVVVVYQGYDSPDEIVFGLWSDQAEAGGLELAADAAGYAASNIAADGTDPHLTLVGHSYGSIVVSYAAQADAPVDDIVLLGSPGVDVSSADQLGPEGHVFAAATPSDYIVPVGIALNSALPYGMSHGMPPSMEGFGAVVFETGSASGHSEYLSLEDDGDPTESLANVAAIAVANYDEVTANR